MVMNQRSVVCGLMSPRCCAARRGSDERSESVGQEAVMVGPGVAQHAGDLTRGASQRGKRL